MKLSPQSKNMHIHHLQNFLLSFLFIIIFICQEHKIYLLRKLLKYNIVNYRHHAVQIRSLISKLKVYTLNMHNFLYVSHTSIIKWVF